MAVKDEQRETAKLRESTLAQWRKHPKAEVHTELPGVTTSGDEKANQPELHAVDGYVLVNTHGETRLTCEDVVTWRKAFERAFQTVA